MLTLSQHHQWSPESWEKSYIQQMPTYPDLKRLRDIEEEIKKKPALVSLNHIDALNNKLEQIYKTQGFLIQVGDCAETFDSSSRYYTAQRLVLFNQILNIIQKKISCPIVTIGRIAGQFAKPRTHLSEKIKEESYPSYQGDIINGIDLKARCPDPVRMLQGYYKTQEILKDIESLTAQAINSTSALLNFGHNFFTIHEAYLLPYEAALCRQDKYERWYDTSAHSLWVGERTRLIRGGHIEFIRGIENSIGVKIGPSADPEDILKLSRILNPQKKEGRLTLIIRMGHSMIRRYFPPLLKHLINEPLLWVCDPMHGNTQKLENGDKTRSFTNICKELFYFFDIMAAHGKRANGVHCEITPSNVTECFNSHRNMRKNFSTHRYASACDPRLNRHQTLELFELCGQWWRNFYT